MNNNRLILIGKYEDNSNFGIMLFDLYNNYQYMKIRLFFFDTEDHYINSDVQGIIYNDYLAVSSTVCKKGDYSNQDEIENLNQNNNNKNIKLNHKYSIFLIFGYVNGTDKNISIENYIRNDTFKSNNNLVFDITENVTIDNNIFGYELIKNQIKLVYIPESIIFYNEKNITKKLENNDILDINYTLNINKDFNNNSSYNYLEYQIMIIEPDYDAFNNLSSEIINLASSNNEFIDERDYYQRKVLYGRTNTLTFFIQPCHKFCLDCNELGISNNAQKCISCKDEYSYFNQRDFYSNCVPENKFYDNEIHQLIDCDFSNSYFYINENNKKICFNKNQNCPDDFPYLNIDTHECLKENTIIYNNTNYINENNENNTKIFYTNEEAYNYMLDILLQFKPDEEKSIYITSVNNMTFEITTSKKEKNELNNKTLQDNLTIIDINKCEDILRSYYNINNKNISLILLKSENTNSIPSEKNVQYEIYESKNKTKLNLSLCDKDDIYFYIPIQLEEKTKKLYDDLNKQGYDLFNINDKFYKDICTPYKTENNTDIILSDRINDIYYKNNNLTLCQDNCEYSDYNSQSKLLKCKCNVNTESIDYKNQKKFTPKKIYESFYEVLKYSNYKVLKCYKLIFEKNPILSNIGSIIVLILFGIYFFFLLFLIFKGIHSFKINVMKSLFKYKKQKILNKNISIINNLNKALSKNKKNQKNIFFPPKRKIIKTNINRKNNSNNIAKKINYNNYKNVSYVNNKIYIMNDSEKKNLENSQKNNLNIIKNDNLNQEEQNNLDDYELNDLDYLEAKNLDKRNIIQIYWSLIKREHKLIFTFCMWNDYNLYYIKFMSFVFLVCTDMAMNVFFFSDESMHKVYLNYGKYDFFQQVPQTIYSTAVSQVIEVLICFLSLTDKYYYQIKNTPKKEKGENKYIIFKILTIIKCKLFGFFLFTFFLFVFYWYLITCFCTVYSNTQIIFIKDFFVSFISGLLYPFILYIFPSILRIISLRVCVKANLSCLYKLSDIIPIF